MRLFNKLFSTITVLILFISLADIVLADSTGLVFNWQPFIVHDYLKLGHHSGNIFPKNSFVYEEQERQFDDSEELLHSNLKTINNSPDVRTKKSSLFKIMVTLSPGNSFMLPGDEMYSRGKDGKLSQAAKTLPSFFQNPSQDTVVETLKLIEPQVNLGFEF